MNLFGLNKPKVNKDTVSLKPSENPNVEKSYWHLKLSGESTTPAMCEYVGSAAFHIYRDRLNPSAFSFSAMTPVGKSHEVWCSEAMKVLKDKLMQTFGRNPPKVRT